MRIYKARNNNNKNSKNGNSSSSLPAIRTNKFNFFFLYELLARRWVCGTFFILCFMSTKTTTKLHSSVMFVFEWENRFFGRHNWCTKLLLKKKLKNAFSQEFLSDLMMREQDTTTTLKTMSTATISYQNIQIYVRAVYCRHKQKTAFRFFWQCKKNHSLLWRVRDRLKKCLFRKKGDKSVST